MHYVLDGLLMYWFDAPLLVRTAFVIHFFFFFFMAIDYYTGYSANSLRNALQGQTVQLQYSLINHDFLI